MSLVGEGTAEERVTIDNLGEVLLFAYADFMRQHAEDQSKASLLLTYAEQLDERAVLDLQNFPLPEEALLSPEQLDRITGPVSQAVALRALADRVRSRNRDVFAIYNYHDYERSKLVVGRTATVKLIEERADRAAIVGWRDRTSLTGKVDEMFLGATQSHILFPPKHMLSDYYKAQPLVDPDDFTANFTIQFHS